MALGKSDGKAETCETTLWTGREVTVVSTEDSTENTGTKLESTGKLLGTRPLVIGAWELML